MLSRRINPVHALAELGTPGTMSSIFTAAQMYQLPRNAHTGKTAKTKPTLHEDSFEERGYQAAVKFYRNKANWGKNYEYRAPSGFLVEVKYEGRHQRNGERYTQVSLWNHRVILEFYDSGRTEILTQAGEGNSLG